MSQLPTSVIEQTNAFFRGDWQLDRDAAALRRAFLDAQDESYQGGSLLWDTIKKAGLGLDSEDQVGHEVLMEGLKALLVKFGVADTTATDLITDIVNLKGDVPMTRTLQGLLWLVFVTLVLGGKTLGGVAGVIEKGVNSKFTPAVGSPEWLIQEHWRSGDRTPIKSIIAEAGLSQEWLSSLAESLRPLPQVADVSRFAHYGNLNERQVDFFLTRLGFGAVDKQQFKDSLYLPPPVDDGIRMMNRGTATEEEMLEWAKQSGLNPDVAERFVKSRLAIPGLDLGYRMRHWDLIDDESLKKIISKQGFLEKEDEKKLFEMRYIPPNLFDLRTMLFRKMITEDDFDAAVQKMGYSEGDADRIRAASYFLPPPSDLIRFAVRDIYTPEVAEKFRLFEDFPQDFAREADRIGIEEPVARQYWAAHWDLPAPGQGFNMFHRGIISFDELRTLLRALDVNPFWRDRMIQLSYNLVPRRALAGWVKQDIISFDDTVQKYLDLGYRPSDALNFTKQIFKQAEEPARDLTKGEVVRAFKDDLIGRRTAAGHLARLDYSPRAVGFLLDTAAIDREHRREARRIKAHEEDTKTARDITRSGILKSYRIGQIKREIASDLLGQIDITPEAAEFLLLAEDRKLTTELVESIEDQTKQFYDAGVLDQTTATARLVGQGFSVPRAKQLVKIWSVDKETRDTMALVMDAEATKGELRRWLGKGIIGAEAFVEGMRLHKLDDQLIINHMADVLDDPSGA